MRINPPLLAAGLLLSLSTLTAEAALTPYSSGGQSLVYSSVSDVTWTQDANLFKTLYDANNTLVNQIASVTPSYNDPVWGEQTIDAGDFNTANGRMTWWGAKAFVNYLNSVNYAGSKLWALPGAGANPYWDQWDYNQTGGQFGQLYYDELNKLAFPGTNGQDYGILGDRSYDTSGTAGPFSNARTSGYWGTDEFPVFPGDAWIFNTAYGYQTDILKDSQAYAWVVSRGQVSAVPVPGAVWLMGSGLLGLLNLKRRGHAG
jgi:hypothetical protein